MIKVLDQGFIELIDSMGDDHFICRAARTSYGKDAEHNEEDVLDKFFLEGAKQIIPEAVDIAVSENNMTVWGTEARILYEGPVTHKVAQDIIDYCHKKTSEWKAKDETLIRRLMRDRHTSPFEMVEFVFCVQVPMDCWRQWIRHRTANVNEYSTRYSEALDFFQQTDEAGWRLQAQDNKQGSSGFVEEWPEDYEFFQSEDPVTGIVLASLKKPDQHIIIPPREKGGTPGGYLSNQESKFQSHARQHYQELLAFGVAREQARKDLPLSTYTRAYWKCDLHNIFNFLELRMDKHAQLEIRSYANAMAELVKQVCPMAFQAFLDYRVNAMKLSAQEIAIIQALATACDPSPDTHQQQIEFILNDHLPNKTEREQCLTKLKKLKIL